MLAAVLSACLLLAWPTAGVARAATKSPVVLAVWAHVDDDVPVAGATVRVYATARPPASWMGQPPARLLVAETSGSQSERTYRTGVRLLEFKHLPAAFTVEVSGGQAGGHRVPGSLSVVESKYLSGTVVDVDPITTLITDDRGPGRAVPVQRATARARAQVYRLLDVPNWENQVDLRYSPRYFDGLSYLQAARRTGGIGALNRTLVRQARRGEHYRFQAAVTTIEHVFRLTVPIARPAALPLAAGALIGQVFKFLAVQAGSSLVQVAGQQAGNAALGWLLAAFGFQDALKDQNVLEIRRIVEQLSKQVTALHGDVALAGFSNLLHQTDRTIGQIAHANSQLALLANMPEQDPTKPAFAQTIVDYIGAKLVDAPEILNQSLGSHVALSDNLIKSASRTLGQRKFFGPKSSAEVQRVYEYFAAYQAQLAMLLQEYYHAKPTVYSPTNNTANLARLHANVESQAGSLKTTVPANTVIDTKSREMWVTDLPNSERRLYDIAALTYGVFSWNEGRTDACGRVHVDGPTNVAGLPYCNWEMPTLEAYKRLVDGWSGRSPAAWLHTQAGFSEGFLSPTNHGYDKWIKRQYRINHPDPHRASIVGLAIETFDLQHDTLVYNRLQFGAFVKWEHKFQELHAGLMYVRKLAPDESYWWSN